MTCQFCYKNISEKRCFTSVLFLKRRSFQTCEDCLKQFEKVDEESCFSCYQKTTLEKCQDCLDWETKGNSVKHKSIYRYNQAMKTYFSVFKFQGDYLMAWQFAEEIKQTLKLYKDFTVVPIPLSKKRMATRRFNQVEALLEAAEISYERILEKKDIDSQTTKTKKERLSLEQVFKIKQDIKIPKKVLLVDDIYTTGQTIFLAKKALQDIGVKEIISFSLAR
ncbi:ComF family protein [Streptococcus pluranimalium]|uniref:ComF family protein n=1 Tax=Streptococcus pluranimalium TaxID=82348 RepID=UPI003F693554